MSILTIFTPTYNRAYTLDRLYQSLVRQEGSSFCWLVIDDGSTDGTEALIKSFIDEGKVDIRYFKQDNGGKQRAHNRAVELCETELFLCLDSDDYLSDGAVSDILDCWESIGDKDSIAGIIAQKGTREYEIMGTHFPEDITESTLWDLNHKYRFRGETALVYRTDILKRYPFPVAPGEKFISESYAYDQIDQNYQMMLLRQIVMICEYLPDGYTNNTRRTTRNNPIGYMRIKRLELDLSTSQLQRTKSTILYLVGAYYSGDYWSYWKELPNKVLAALCIAPSFLIAKTIFAK